MSQIGRVNRIYVWSVILEPMVFFVVVHQDVIGFGGNVSRLLQFIVGIRLILSAPLLSKFSKVFVELYRGGQKYYYWFILYSFIVFLVSLVFYWCFLPYDIFLSYFGYLRQFIARVFFEYFIALYYLIYFLVLPVVFVVDDHALEYFFRCFFGVFWLSVAVGFVDMGVGGFVGRHLCEHMVGAPVLVGSRFHGLFGEPRDAFVVLGLGLVLLVLWTYYQGRKLRISLVLFLFLCMLMTASASGLLALIIFPLVLFLGYPDVVLKRPYVVFFVICFFSVFFVGMFVFSDRIGDYYDSIRAMYSYGDSFLRIDQQLSGQANDIFPVFWAIDSLMHGNFVVILFGGGLGSSSAINNVLNDCYGVWDGVYWQNSHSNLIRMLSDYGVFGLFLFISLYCRYVSAMISRLGLKRLQNIAPYMISFILSLGLAHRSAAVWIFCGIVASLVHNMEARCLRDKAFSGSYFDN